MKYTTFIIFNDNTRAIVKIGATPDYSKVSEELLIEQLEEDQSIIFWARDKGLCKTYEDIKKIKDGVIKVEDLHFAHTTREVRKDGQLVPIVKRVKAVFV